MLRGRARALFARAAGTSVAPAAAVQSSLARVAGIRGAKRDAAGRFIIDAERFPSWDADVQSFSALLRWQRTTLLDAQGPTPTEAELARLPVRHPHDLDEPVPDGRMRATWLGHASVLAQWDGWNVLADPIFSHRCFPVQFFGPARLQPSPVQADDLPRIDVVIISHNHYDHLDLDTVRALASAEHPPMWFVPLGTKEWMTAWANVHNVVEMDWGEQATLTHPGRPDMRLTCLPCQHWCARGFTDKNRALWASWLVATGDASTGPPLEDASVGSHPVTPAANPAADAAPAGAVADSRLAASYFFGGDTGYCGDVFRSIGRTFKHVDVAAIPIGAYGSESEAWFHGANHMNPEEAVATRTDLNARHALAIHWGTFRLTKEPVLEPAQRLTAARDAAGLESDEFCLFEHGESRCFPLLRDVPPDAKQAH